MCSDILWCSQMFSNDHRSFSRYSIDVLLMFDAPMGLVGPVDFDDHFTWKYGLYWSKGTRWSQLFDDPSYSIIPSYSVRCTRIIWDVCRTLCTCRVQRIAAGSRTTPVGQQPRYSRSPRAVIKYSRWKITEDNRIKSRERKNRQMESCTFWTI